MRFVRDALSLQNMHVRELISQLKAQKILPKAAKPYSIFSYMFVITNALLLAIKAKSVVRKTIEHVRDGRAVVIGLSQTSAAHLEPQRLINLMGKNVKVGDMVLYGKYSGTEVEIDGTKYMIMKESDIYAII